MTTRALLLGISLVASAAACGQDAPTAPEPQTLTFGPFDLDPGEEMFGDCVSASLNNDEAIYVNAVELVTQSGFHHSNWFWVPESMFAGPDGVWDCDSRSYDEVTAGAAGAVLFAQSTQSVTERQEFPDGIVIPIPPHSKIVSGIHMLNASDSPLQTGLELTITPIRAEDVTVKLKTMAMVYEPLALPANRKSEVSIECDLADLHQRLVGTPLDFNLYYSLPHYHSLGRGYEVVAVGGPSGDVVIASSEGQIGEPLGQNLEPAFNLAGFQKVRFTCKFDNTTSSTVRWGIGDGEMCVWQGFTDSIYKWGGRTTPNATTQRVDDGEVVHFDHPCDMYGFPVVDP